jgi:2-(1,2-epoxy-1,2-dihydrophenyl)acetyl-CoA isomerase
MSENSSEKVRLDRSGAVATITLNRPSLGNAIDLETARGLRTAFEGCAGDAKIRCVVLTGAGRLFCVGGDIGCFADAGDSVSRFLRELADELHAAVIAAVSMPKPLITAINGPAAGAGMSLAMLGDIAIAVESAQFTAAYTRVGLTPDGGMSRLLPRLCGLRVAQSIILSNRPVSATEARRMGLVTQVSPDRDLGSTVEAIARQFASGPAWANGRARRLLWESSSRDLPAHLEEEAASISHAGGMPAAREGMDAFLSRRDPNFAELA